MAKDFSTMEDSNRSANADIHTVSDPARRLWLQGGLGALATGVLGPLLAGCATLGDGPLLGFKGIPTTDKDTMVVPEGYEAVAFAAWGEPIGVPGNMPAFRWDVGNSAADQAVQMGMHHDGLHYVPLDGSRRGLLVMNHEYTDDGLLHSDGMKTWSAEKVRKAQAAHGVSVIEVEFKDGRWTMVRPSTYARRFTAYSPFRGGRPGRRPCADEDCSRPGRHHGARHVEQLRQRHDAVGHVSFRRGELRLLLRRAEAARCRPAPLGHARDGLLSLAGARRALGCEEAPERVPPLRLGGGDRPARPGQRAGQAHRARPRRARRRLGGRHQGRPCGGVLGRRRALRIHLQVRQPRQDRAGRRQGQCHAAGPRHAVRGPLRCRRHADAGCRWWPARAR